MSFVSVVILICISLSSCSIIKETEHFIKNVVSGSGGKLYDGLQNNNLEMVKEAINEGYNINEIKGVMSEQRYPVWGTSGKQYAINKEIFYLLVENGANLEVKYPITKITLLQYFAKESNYEMLKYLLDNGADKDAVYSGTILNNQDKGYRALEFIFTGGKSEKKAEQAFNLLMEYGIAVEPVTLKASLSSLNNKLYYKLCKRVVEELRKNEEDTGLTPLLEAAILGKSDELRNLLKKGEKPKTEDIKNLIFFTAAFCDFGCMDALYKVGIDIRVEDEAGRNALMIAAYYGNYLTVEYLMPIIDAKKTDHQNKNALVLAAGNNQKKSVQFLLNNFVNNQPYNFTEDAFQVAVAFSDAVNNNSTGVIETISKCGYIHTSEVLIELLRSASVKGYTDMVKALSDAAEKKGISFTKYPLLSGSLELLQYSFSKGATTNDEDALTLARTAILEGKLDILEALLQNGLNPNDETETFLLKDAVIHGRLAALELLVKYGADINKKSGNDLGNTALIYACMYDSQNILSALLVEGANIDYQNSDGKTGLMIAAEKNKKKQVELLLKNNVNKTIKNNNGKTAYEIAKENGHKAIKSMLK